MAQNDTALASCWLADQEFGPRVQVRCREFDFTVTFEQSILSILPSALFIVLASIRIYVLIQKSPKVHGRYWQISKVFLSAAFGIFQLILLVLYLMPQRYILPVLVASLTVSLVDAILLCTLSYLEHERSLHPSSLMVIYLFISALLDAARLRTLWLLPIGRLSFSLASSIALATKVAMLVSESAGKARYFLHPDDKERSPEETSGILSNGLFVWANHLLFVGFRKLLLLSDLYRLPNSLSVTATQSKFGVAWDSTTPSSYRLAWAILKAFYPRLLLPVTPRLFLLAFTLLQPILMQNLLNWLSNHNERESIGYGLLGAYVAVYVGLAVFTGLYWRLHLQLITMIRGTLISSIYRKVLTINMDDAQKATLTLMSNDVEMSCHGLQHIHELYANILQIGIATWLLQRQIGASCAIPAVVAAICAVATYKISQHVGHCQKEWLETVQTRLNATTSTLSNMKSIKLSGLETRLNLVIRGLRDKELETAKKYRTLLVSVMGLAYTPSAISPVLSLAIYSAQHHNKLDSFEASRIYAAISLIGLITSPLNAVFQQVPPLVTVVRCFERLQKFLELDRHTDYRAPLLQDSAIKEKGTERLIIEAAHNDSESPKEESHILRIQDASFAYHGATSHVLNGVSICIPRSKVTAIIGPVGCGKSAFLKSLLGEMKLIKGKVSMGFGLSSYCDQSPWIQNGTIQENILGCTGEIDMEWYRRVLWACELEHDLSLFPEHDQSNVGSDGVALSGGQKQRIAMARALYARQEVVIMDDAFSALDGHTEKNVIERLAGPNGILRTSKLTVVIATSKESILPYADLTISLNQHGSIEAQNTRRSPAGQDTSAADEVTLEASEKDISCENDSTKANSTCQPPKEKTSNRDTQQVTFPKVSVYRSYFRSIGFWRASVLIGLLVLQSVFSKIPNVWLLRWLDTDVAERGRLYAENIGVYSLLQCLALIFTISAAFQQLRVVMPHSSRNFHTRLLEAVFRLRIPVFASIDVGSITNKFSQDLQLLDWTLPVTFLNASEGAFGTLVQAVITAVSSPYAFIALPALVLILFGIQRFYLRTSRQLRVMDIEAKSPLITHFMETINGVHILRAFGWEQPSQRIQDTLLNASQQPYYQLFMVQRWLNLVLDITAAGIAILIVGLAIRFRTQSTLVGLALVNIISINETLQLLILQWASMEVALGSVTRLQEFMGTATSSSEDPTDPTTVETPPPTWPAQGGIMINNLSVRYKPDSPTVLNNISLFIPAGSKVGICGRTGSGKSTFLSTLFHLTSIANGSIVIDGIDISRISPVTLRTHLIAIPQHPYLIPSASVKENLSSSSSSSSPSVSEEEIIGVLKKVRLWELVSDRGGLDSVIEIEALSAGQRQLFSCARALLQRGGPGSIVVLDEPTSNLDHGTRELVHRVIMEGFRDKTVLMILHEVEMFVDFDMVVELRDGRVGTVRT